MCMNRNAELLPYYQKAKELLNYDPETGIFTKKMKVTGCFKKMGKVAKNGYHRLSVTIDGKQKTLGAHRVAWFFEYSKLPKSLDHINRNPLDNRIVNLRECTNIQNQHNTEKQINNTSGYKGVVWHKRINKWIAQINHNKKRLYIGSFYCPKEASKAYELKAKELHKEFYKEQSNEKTAGTKL